MVGIVNKEVVFTPFEIAIKHHLEINPDMMTMAAVLST
jgi:6-phosphofructokinase 1